MDLNLNAPHVHLLVNHVPVFFFLFGVAALADGWWRRRRDHQAIGAALCLLGALATVAAFASGERAEGQVEGLPGVTESIVEEHEESAESARAAAIVAAVLAVASLALLWRHSPAARPVSAALLLVALLTFAILARTALLGGEVRHTEVRAGAAAAGSSVPAD